MKNDVIKNERSERNIRMTNFELWVKACEEFDDQIYKLTKNQEDGHGVYQTIKEYFPPKSYNTMRCVTYHLWWHGKHEMVGSDYYSIINLFEQRGKDGYIRTE